MTGEGEVLAAGVGWCVFVGSDAFWVGCDCLWGKAGISSCLGAENWDSFNTMLGVDTVCAPTMGRPEVQGNKRFLH